MAQFGVAALLGQDVNADHILLDANTMTPYFTSSNVGNYYFFAVSVEDDYYYLVENGVLKRRSLSNGDLQKTEFESVGDVKPLFVDSYGYLWTMDMEVGAEYLTFTSSDTSFKKLRLKKSIRSYTSRTPTCRILTR